MSEKKAVKNIYQRIHDVMREVGFVQKVENKKLGFSTVAHDHVTTQLQPALIKHGVCLVPTTISLEQIPVTQVNLRKQTSLDTYRATVVVKLKWVCIDNPDDFIENEFAGSSCSNDGKCVAQAYSFAVKTGQLKTLCIPTGEDEEMFEYFQRECNEPSAMEQAEASQKVKEQQAINNARQQLGQLCEERCWPRDAVSEFLLKEAKVAVNDMDVRQLEKAKSLLIEKFSWSECDNTPTEAEESQEAPTGEDRYAQEP